MNESLYTLGWYLRNYAKTLYLISLLLARKRWQRTAMRSLREGGFAQAGFATERADLLAVEIRHLLKKFPRRECVHGEEKDVK